MFEKEMRHAVEFIPVGFIFFFNSFVMLSITEPSVLRCLVFKSTFKYWKQAFLFD